MRRLYLLAILLSAGIAAGCTTIPADVAADYDTLNANVQKLLPKLEAHAARVASDSTASVASQAAARHDRALAAATRLLSDKLATYVKKHSDQAEVAAIHSQRIAASTPTTVKGN